MKIKHHEVEMPNDNPFLHCKLEREPYAKVLTEIVNTYSDGFVLAINNEWGTGKTTFVKMWKKQLLNSGFQTIYFNAWENDFDSNPLVALMSELETLKNTGNKKIFKSVLEKGAVLVKNVVPVIAKAVLKKYVGDVSEITVEVVEESTKASTELLEEAIKQYTSKKKTILEFRQELEKFVKNSDNENPLIFIVDELDRCRPNYAVEVLEQIKHYFGVPGIVFVLSIDKKHLSSSVKGFYGSEEIDSDEYLRRFIDLEYSIPKPQADNFIDYLYDYYGFNDPDLKSNLTAFRDDGNLLKNIAKILFSKSNATLRQQDRIFALTRLILCSFNVGQNMYPHLLFVLVYLKSMKIDLFHKIENKEFTLKELSDAFYDLIYSDIYDQNGFNILYIEALLLWFYNNNLDSKNKIKLLDSSDANNLVSPIESKLEIGNDKSSLAQCFSYIQNQFEMYDLKLDYFVKKVNLTELISIQ